MPEGIAEMTVFVSLDSMTKCPKLKKLMDGCLLIPVKVRKAAWMGSAETLFLPGRKSLVWFRFKMSLTGPHVCTCGPQVVALF